jgi:transposase-like protein
MPGIFQKRYQDEDAAREHLEKILWKNGPVCPHCGVVENIYKLESKPDSKHKLRKGVYKCGGCRKQFTVTVNTIFEDSHIPLHKWLLAFHLMCSSKKGISALQLQRNLWDEDEETRKPKGSYRTAWFMCHRIRWVMTQSPFADKLKGIVEVDETYVGGRQKGKGGGSHMRPEITNKTPVLALLERGGDVRSFPLPQVTLKNIKPILERHIDPNTHLMTDDHAIYYWTRDLFPQHHVVQHKIKEYTRKEEQFTVTTNTVESYFSLLKRSNYGTYHHWSEKYMGQYCAEVDFRYNGRKLTDSERTEKALRQSEGKRLMLKHPKNS